MTRELVLAAGGFHDDVPGCEDWDLWVRLARMSPLVYLDRPLAAWRIWEGQGSGNARMMLRSADLVRTKYFPDLGPLDRQYAQFWLGSAARRQLSRKHRVQAASQFLQLARVGRAPGQLCAMRSARLIAPSLTERRLKRIEPTAPLPDPHWRDLAEALAERVCRKCLRIGSAYAKEGCWNARQNDFIACMNMAWSNKLSLEQLSSTPT